VKSALPCFFFFLWSTTANCYKNIFHAINKRRGFQNGSRRPRCFVFLDTKVYRTVSPWEVPGGWTCLHSKQDCPQSPKATSRLRKPEHVFWTDKPTGLRVYWRQRHKFITSTSRPHYPPLSSASIFIQISSPTYLPSPLFFPSCSSTLTSRREFIAG
jgi:hypothetical protein